MKEKMKGGRKLELYSLHQESEFEYSGTTVMPQESIDGLIGFCKILRNIHNRLQSEGYDIIEGSLYSPTGQLLYERKQNKI